MTNINKALRHQTTHRENGANIEWACAIHLRNLGSYAVITAEKSAPFDVISWGENSIYLIQAMEIEAIEHADHAVDQAKQAWQAYWQPLMYGVHREVWLRCNHKWYIVDLDAS